MRRILTVSAISIAAFCTRTYVAQYGAALAENAVAPSNAPSAMAHLDHTPRHGGLVLMNGDLHYEVVLDRTGRYSVYFSDAVRTPLPPSIHATYAPTMNLKPNQPVEFLVRTCRTTHGSESWDFGDGTTATGIEVRHRYRAAGTYTARLLVRDEAGLENSVATDEVVVEVNAQPTPVVALQPGNAADCAVRLVTWLVLDRPARTTFRPGPPLCFLCR